MQSIQLKKILGQLFLIGFQGAVITPQHPVTRDIKEENLGGVILFDRHLATKSQNNNVVNKDQLKNLTTSLQNTVKNEQPLFIAVDQEGGAVSRFKHHRGFLETPSAADLGAERDTEKTHKAAAQTASLLQESGINLNFAPVADLNIWPENPIIGALGRSFSQNPATVTKHCQAWISEHKARGILTSLKHFPGHGSSWLDSHHDFVDISKTWKEEELQPYRELIQRKMADSVMVGHLFHRKLDNKWPATLSYKIVHLLKEELGFQGPVITDDMQMKAITQRYGLADACCKSLAAGADIIVIGNNIEYDATLFKKIKENVLKEIQQGNIKESRIINAWQRVTTLKNRLTPSKEKI